MSQSLPKLLSAKFFSYYAFQVCPLCLHYAPRLATFFLIFLEHFNQ